MTAAIALPPERPGRPLPPDLVQRRAEMAEALASGVFAVSPAPEERVLGGRRVLRVAPPAEVRGRVFHLHGGGFRNGVPEMEAPYAAALARRCGVEVVLPAYRLAPEHPFPAGLGDAWAALQAYAARGDGSPLIVSGQSAGGGLAAGLAVLAGRAGLRLDALVLIAPWADLTVTAPSYGANAATDPLFSPEAARTAAELYLQGFDPAHPLASPLFAGDFHRFPPTQIVFGAGEVLADDSRALHARLAAAGVRAELVGIDGMEHVAVTRDRSLPGAAEAFEAIAAFIGGAIASSLSGGDI